jgi:regulation of enolase protein 1 (concanavalin A-like superfamily)
VPLVYDDFVMTTSVRFAHARRGDAAGLLVRINADCWLRVGAQATGEAGGDTRVVAVVANGGASDASAAEWGGGPVNECGLRVRREGRLYVADVRFPGRRWATVRSLRLADDRPGGPVAAGLFAAAPGGKGASAEFDGLRIRPGRVMLGAASSGSLVG